MAFISGATTVHQFFCPSPPDGGGWFAPSAASISHKCPAWQVELWWDSIAVPTHIPFAAYEAAWRHTILLACLFSLDLTLCPFLKHALMPFPFSLNISDIFHFLWLSFSDPCQGRREGSVAGAKHG